MDWTGRQWKRTRRLFLGYLNLKGNKGRSSRVNATKKYYIHMYMYTPPVVVPDHAFPLPLTTSRLPAVGRRLLPLLLLPFLVDRQAPVPPRALVSVPEPRVYVAPVERPRPPHQHQRHQRADHRGRRDDQERPPVALHPEADPAAAALLRGRRVVEPPRHAHVQDVGAHGAGHAAQVVERGVVLEPEHLRDDGEHQRPLRAEAEPDDHRRRVQGPRRAQRDQHVPRARQRQHARQQQRPRHAVPGQRRLRGVARRHAPRVVPDADQGHERVDAPGGVAQRLADLPHVVDRRQRPAHAADCRHEQHQHVHAHQRLQDRVVLPTSRRTEHGPHAPTERRRRRRRRRRRLLLCFLAGVRCRRGDDGRRRRVGRVELALPVDLVLLLDDDAEGHEEEDEQRRGGHAVRGAGEGHLLLHHDHDEEEARQRDGEVEEAEEGVGVGARLLPAAATAARVRHVPDGVDEHDGHRRGEPGDEEDQRLGVVAAVQGQVQLRVHGAAEADEALEDAEHHPAAVGEVLDAGHQRAGVGERLRVGAHEEVEAHEPQRRRRGAPGHGQVHHEVPGQVHGGAHGQHHPRRGHLVDEPREDAQVGAEVLEEGHGVERALVVPERRLERAGVAPEDVRRAGRRHDEQAREHRQPPPREHLPREPARQDHAERVPRRRRRRPAAARVEHHGGEATGS
uniref:Uncharacterized protein n=1 Tax=Zea mays TaxID=4577 RepID=A0A804MWB6_MAIZE